MFTPLITRAKAHSGRLKTSAPKRSTLLRHHVGSAAEHGLMRQRTIADQAGLPLLALSHEQPADRAGMKPTSSPSWDFSKISLFPSDRSRPLTNIRPLDACNSASGVDAAAYDEATPLPEEPESPELCGDRMRAVMGISTRGQSKLNVGSPGDQSEEDTDRAAKNACDAAEGGHCDCPTCADGALPAQDAFAYTVIEPRGSYGHTDADFTRPSCRASGAGATIVAGSVTPTIHVYPTGTYRVTRSDGVVKTARCTRLAAGLAATRAHEEHHAAGIRAAVAAANTAQGLPREFLAAPAQCTAALPAVVAAWNTPVDAAWANEKAHGPGTSPPTATTFAQENAAGTCTFT
jgi:hypothetical protein